MTYKENSNVFLKESNMPCELSLNISGPCWGLSQYRKMVYAPWENGQTIKNTNNLTPYLLNSDSGTGSAFSYYSPRIQMTTNYAFIQRHISVGNDEKICRYSIEDLSEIEYNPNSVDYWFWESAVYSDDIVYTLEVRIQGYLETLVIFKVTFNPDGGIQKEEVFSWLAENEESGPPSYIYWDLYFFGRFKYENDDCIITVLTYIGDDAEYNYLWKVVIHHINTGATSEQWIVPSDDMNADMYYIFMESSSPSFYNSKMVFVAKADPPYDIPGPPYGSHCLFPVYIIDISDDSVTVINSHKYNLDNWTYVSVSRSSVINPATGIFYFSVWVEPDSGYSGTFLFSMDTYSPIVVMGNECSTRLEFHQGKTEIYAIDNLPSPGTCNVLRVPTMEIITDVNTLFGAGYNEGLAAIDIDNNMIWNTESDKLQGKSLLGAGDRDIAINWGGGTIPFLYSTRREIWLAILDGNCVMIIYSRQASPLLYQTEYYLLKKN